MSRVRSGPAHWSVGPTPTLEVVEHALGRLVAVVGVLLQQAADKFAEPAGDTVHRVAQPGGASDVRVDQGQVVDLLKRGVAREQLEEDRSQPIEVGAGVHRSIHPPVCSGEM